MKNILRNTENYTENCLKLLKQLVRINTVNPPDAEYAKRKSVKNEAEQ